MSRSLLGASLGAGAATVYLKPEIVQDYVKEVVFGPSRPQSASMAPVGKELEHLQRLVEDLSRQVASSRQQPVTVVHTGGADRASSYVVYGVAAAGLGVVIYFRVLKGWTFGDMLYATRRGLKEGLGQVSQGLDQLGAKVAEVKAKLQERIAHVMRKQEEMLGAQAEMQAALTTVGKDVEHTRGQVGQIHALVMDLEASMAEVGVNQRHANHGIYVLCKAVSELMAGSNIPSKTELIEYTQQQPVWASGERLQGLESLLAGGGMRRVASARGRDENTSPERRGPFLLPVGGMASSGAAPRKALSETAAEYSGILHTAGSSSGGDASGGGRATYHHPYSVTFPSNSPPVSVNGGGGSSGSGWDWGGL